MPTHAPTSTPMTRSDHGIVWLICLALLGTALFVDPYAEAAFDAPKRLVAMLAAGTAAALLVWSAQWPNWRVWPPAALWSLLLLLLAMTAALVSAFVSPHPVAAWSTLRTLLVFGLFLPLGASRALDGQGGVWVLRVVLFAVAANAVLSLLQAAGLPSPIPLARLSGRFPTGALLGNEGYVALSCALLGAACVAWALNSSGGQRRAAWLLASLMLITILVNRQLTSAIALFIAVIALLVIRWRARWILALGLVGVLAAGSVAVVTPLREVTWSALPVGGAEGYQRLTTYRLGAWAAALEMLRERPWSGFGPGSYPLEAQRQRLRAEIRWSARLLPPPTGTAFTVAHQDYLQAAAELGLVTVLCLLASLSALIMGLLRLLPSPGPLPLALFALIMAGAVAALAWFPMQIPFTAVLLLLALGRAWRLLVDAPGQSP